MTALAETPHTHFTASAFAPRPAEERGLARDEVRLLVGTPDGLEHARFRDLPDHLRAGDVLVVNTSATVPAEVDAVLDGRPVVLHVAHALDDGDRVVELRTAPDAARALLDASTGAAVSVGDVRLVLRSPWPDARPSSPTGEGNRLWRASVRGDLDRQLDRDGRPIAYGYLDRRYPISAYQTVFGTRPGSAEMASAGRPFTHELVTRLVTAGVQIAPITLHTGVSSQEAGEAPGPEWFEVPPSSARTINTARAAGGRVIAVGTTATRAVESTVRGGHVVAGRGWTSRVITPGDPPCVVDGLVTGWHDPMASHLLLVEAVAGQRLTQAAYDAAVAEGYLWHEFGDAALLLRR
ncbi:S-adenosylmethionine:tRNA ribosyltransferase-isomerase [Nocardioides alpinus]|uniref:S-adenosylmethionine:tRNA ribosyltransferase-isomerase n=1 Tax=Nocardioides alpinus TaxID=748909 RepID=A0A1I0ZBK4_9ACTN|nr:S-adenosylmethionine:tRNA ribosyltransferase-isomerase [Nocardioides alpinus]PKH40734.1 S-adenosylmethionine:tRNA ribosyltransferase-isomerase [Nocardioides alpinus]SFB22516.1 S-adenosylmethionine:tRNA ribosyltransferase-isomerase [Nocardioides alpinus]